jgi:membrane protein
MKQPRTAPASNWRRERYGFPLLIVLVTCLAWLLPASDKASVLGHVAKMLPLLDPSTVSGLGGSWWVLVIGLLTALWSGTGVVRTLQFAFDSRSARTIRRSE